MAHTAGFQTLGEVLGGGIDREGAFQEGLLLGGKTQEALAKAKIRRDEAEQRLKLGQAIQDIGVDPTQAGGLETILRGGFGNIRQGVQSLGDVAEQATRAGIADPSVTPEIGDINRQLASLATGPVDPVQGAGAGLFAELFGPEAGEVQVAPTGVADIFATEELGKLREAKRLRPEDFRAGGTTINLGGKTLSESLAEIESTIPEDIGDPAEALGLPGAVRNTINTVIGAFNEGVPFPEADAARAVVQQMAVMGELEGAVAIPGRPTNFVRERLATLEVAPGDLLRGKTLAVNRWKARRDFIQRQLELTTQQAEVGTESQRGKSFRAAQTLATLVADYNKILELVEAANQEIIEAADVGSLDVGDTITIEGGTIKRTK